MPVLDTKMLPLSQDAYGQDVASDVRTRCYCSYELCCTDTSGGLFWAIPKCKKLTILLVGEGQSCHGGWIGSRLRASVPQFAELYA